MGFVDLREVGGKNLMNWDAAQIADVQTRPRAVQAPRRLPRDADLQGRLAGRAEVAVQPEARRVRRRLHVQAAGRAARARLRAGARRSTPIGSASSTSGGSRIRNRTARRSTTSSARRRSRRRSAASRSSSRTNTRATRRPAPRPARLLTAIPEQGARDHLGSGQRAVPRRSAVSRRLRSRSPKGRIGHVHCKDAVQGRRRQDGSGWRWGRGVIDWAGQFRALKAGRLSPCRHARNALARRRHAGGVDAPELRGDEGVAAESRGELRLVGAKG